MPRTTFLKAPGRPAILSWKVASTLNRVNSKTVSSRETLKNFVSQQRTVSDYHYVQAFGCQIAGNFRRDPSQHGGSPPDNATWRNGVSRRTLRITSGSPAAITFAGPLLALDDSARNCSNANSGGGRLGSPPPPRSQTPKAVFLVEPRLPQPGSMPASVYFFCRNFCTSGKITLVRSGAGM